MEPTETTNYANFTNGIRCGVFVKFAVLYRKKVYLCIDEVFSDNTRGDYCRR